MPPSVGDKLGPYEILAPIGAGGMGAVYRARDTRLGRDVAIKIAAERFSERFEKEARAIAALNHPNVCTLHDVGPNYLVMELVEGQTLSDRIKQGAIPLDDALAIAKQIAAALEAAHEKGITHRDLKPGNINLKPDGTVKVLDFGLAKMSAGSIAQTEDSPTFTIATEAGVILGTAPYMAPEQARGKAVDWRADIWAFGVVLHEMLTARKLFKGDDVSEVLASVIKEQPKLDRAPAQVRRLLRSCLEKDPKQRLQAIGDWRLLLDSEQPAKASAGKLSWIVSAMLAIVAAIAFWSPWRRTESGDRPLVRLDVDLGVDITSPSGNRGERSVAISPDGMRLAYSLAGVPPKLFTRRLDQPNATELPGTQGATAPFFSPDGKWIGYVGSTGGLYKISVEGGAVIPLGYEPYRGGYFSGADWDQEGNLLVGEAFGRGLLRVPAGGGRQEIITPLVAQERSLSYPHILPGGKAILFAAVADVDADKVAIEVLTLADHRRKVVARGGTSAHYLPAPNGLGHLVYTHKSTLFAVPFDLDKLETRGTAVPILDDVAYAALSGAGQFDVSPGPGGHGSLVYRSGGALGLLQLRWIYPDSGPAGDADIRIKPGLYRDLRISPDGTRIALADTEAGSTDIWVYDLERDSRTRLTYGGSVSTNPVWSPDGRHVVFSSEAPTGKGLSQVRADGAGQPEPLLGSRTAALLASCFAPDGKSLAYTDFGAGKQQIWTVTIEEQDQRLKAGTPAQFLDSSFADIQPAFSPDGRWLAYASNESGKPEVYVRPFPVPASRQGRKWQVSNSSGATPRWSRNLHDLVYQNATTGAIMIARYSVKGDTFVTEPPRVWISKVGVNLSDLAPNGTKVLVLPRAESAENIRPQHEVFLENFFDYLRQRVPLPK